MSITSRDRAPHARRAGLLIPGVQTDPFPIVAVPPSACSRACPAGINVKAYVSLIAEGRFAEALEVVRERCPLPGICGRVCHHPCEGACQRGEVDQPVAIRALKRFVADLELELPEPPPPPPADKSERVAIVGSGPAGLAAAWDLRRAGYPVTVFEAEAEPGGMLRYGIADYRLPTDVLEAEIGVIERAGVRIESGRRVGEDPTLEELLSEGYSVVLLAVGAQRGRRLGLPGEDECSGVEDALTFLRRVNDGDRTPVEGRVLVIGGGSTAIETARAALRLGADAVEIVYRRHRGEMPAAEEEIDVAAAEGVTYRFLTAPSRVVSSDGRLTGLECLEVALGELDASGRRRPVALPGSEFVIDADRVFAAVGQQAELGFLPVGVARRLARRGLMTVDDATSMTALRSVFAAGDVVSGPSTVIDAIAAGHRAAEAMLEFLEQGRPADERRREPATRPVEFEIPRPPPPHAPRHHAPHADIRAGREFDEVELALSPADAVAEARRCLRCGPCAECRICAPSCGRRHLSLRISGGEEQQRPWLLRAPVSVASRLEERIDSRAPETAWLLGDPLPDLSALVPEDACPLTVTPARIAIDAEHCRGCARCLEVCAFDALALVDPEAPETTVRVEASLCRGCNLCAGVCPTDAVLPAAVAPGWWGTRLADLWAPLAAAPEDARPRVVLACERRAAAVEASLGRAGHLGARTLLVPVRCAGQLPAGQLLEIYRHGADEVVVAGCLAGSCRYGCGPQLAAAAVESARGTLAAMGAAAERIAADWAEDASRGLGRQPGEGA